MAQVVMPRKKTGMEFLPMAGQIAGGVVGGIKGGPSGALAGSQAGGAAGGMAAGIVDKATGASDKQAAMEAQGQNAVQRRMAQIESDPVYTLNQAKQALAAMPADVQQQYQKPIDEAYQRAIAQSRQNQQRGMA